PEDQNERGYRVSHPVLRAKPALLGDAHTIGSWRCYPTPGGSVKRRQQHGELGSAHARALDVDPAAVRLDDLLGNGEPQTAAGTRGRARLIELIEALEDARLIGRRDERPGIVDRNVAELVAAPMGRRAMAGTGRRRHGAGRDRDRAASRGVLQGVV